VALHRDDKEKTAFSIAMNDCAGESQQQFTRKMKKK
jgi:hypothetical protein